MTCHRDWFCELDENIKRKVKFADYKAVMAEGVGKVVIQRKYGNKYLITDVQKQDIKDWNYSTRS